MADTETPATPETAAPTADTKAAATGEKVAEAAAKSERAWYKFATHAEKEGKVAFSAPRTAVSGAILLGTGLAVSHFMKKPDEPQNWQDRAQAPAPEAAVQR